MTADEALQRLGEAVQGEVASALEALAPGSVERGPVEVIHAGTSPVAGVSLPALAANAAHGDGVSGGNLFVISRAGARRIAAAMLGSPAEGIEDDDLSELELSATGEAMSQVMAAAARATSGVLDAEVEVAKATVRVVTTPEEAAQVVEESPYAAVAMLTVLGEPARLVQFVPTAFVMRMTRALTDLEGAVDEAPAFELVETAPGEGGVSIRLVPVNLSVELGRARMPVGDAVRLWRGAVVELDEAADEPLLVEVNGHPFARGRLLLTEEGEWAVRIEELLRG